MTCLKFSTISIPTYCLIAVFAISSWVDIVGLWVELPLIINHLPERWKLPSYMALVIQLSNIAPALYSIISKCRSLTRTPEEKNAVSAHRKRDVGLSFGIISIETLSIFILSFFWSETAFFGGSQRSIALLGLLASCSLCSCLSSLVYLPYMARYPSYYLSAYYIGQGLSGLLPGMLGLMQGLGGDPTCVNKTEVINSTCYEMGNCSYPYEARTVPIYPDPRFSVEVFFILVSIILVISGVAFYALNFTKLKRHQSPNTVERKKIYTLDDESENKGGRESILPMNYVNETSSSNERGTLVFHLVLVFLLNACTNGILPSTQSYTCLAYGNIVYTLAIRLSSIVGSISSLSTMFLPKPNGKVLGLLTTCGLCVVIFHLTLAFQSPHPILQYHPMGPVLVVSYFFL